MGNSLTFVLWGEQFEEFVAVNLVATLREAGLATAIGGLTARNCAGRHGITIYPDFTLSNVSTCTNPINCIVLPCTTAVFTLVDNDPRLHRLLEMGLQAGARLLVHQPRTIIETSLRDIAHMAKEIIYFTHYPNPICMAESLAEKLKADI